MIIFRIRLNFFVIKFSLHFSFCSFLFVLFVRFCFWRNRSERSKGEAQSKSYSKQLQFGFPRSLVLSVKCWLVPLLFSCSAVLLFSRTVVFRLFTWYCKKGFERWTTTASTTSTTSESATTGLSKRSVQFVLIPPLPSLPPLPPLPPLPWRQKRILKPAQSSLQEKGESGWGGGGVVEEVEEEQMWEEEPLRRQMRSR